MKCLVCQKELKNISAGDNCPFCTFPVVEFLGNPEEEIKKIQPVIREKRVELIKASEIGLMVYKTAVAEDASVSEQSGEQSFGKLANLVGKTSWLQVMFDNPSKRTEVPATVCLHVLGEQQQITVNVQKPAGAAPLQLGITVTEDCTLRLALRDPSGAVTESSPVSVYDYLFS